MKRIPLPKKLEKKILIKNRHTCCICQKDGIGQEVWIHHIDGNNSNNTAENLAVLCLVHASMSDAGLNIGKCGSGKKLKPDEIKEFKKIWEKKNEFEQKHTKNILPTYKKKQLGILYEFEINKIKNKIISLPDKDIRIKEFFDFFDQLVIEETISGINLRKILLNAYKDIAIQALSGISVPKKLVNSLWSLEIHLVGPKEVPIHNDDKQVFKKCLEIFETLGDFSATFNQDSSVFKRVCRGLYEFYEIASWYKLKQEKKEILKKLSGFKKSCLEFEKEKKSKNSITERKIRIKILENYINKAKQLK